MSSVSVLTGPVAASILAAATVVRAYRWRQTRSASGASTTVMLAALAVAAAMNVPDWSAAVDGGGWTWSFLLSRSALIVVAGAALALVRVTNGAPAGSAVPITLIAMVAQAVCFFMAGSDAGSGRELLTETHDPWLVGSEVVVNTAAVIVGVLMLRMTASTASRSDPHGQGMGVMCAGVAVALVYVVVRLVALILIWADVLDLAETMLDAIVPVAALGLVLIAVACVYAPAARAVIALGQYRTIRHLHAELVGGPPPRTLRPIADVDTMVTEIGDAIGASDQLDDHDGDLREWAICKARSLRRPSRAGRA